MQNIPTLTTRFTAPNGTTAYITTCGVGGTPTLLAGYTGVGGAAPIRQTFDSTADLNTAAAKAIASLSDNGWTLVTYQADTKATFQVGDRVTTPHGPGTITKAPIQMASGWIASVDLDTPITASGGVSVDQDDLTHA